jgi:hypothetical protein
MGDAANVPTSLLEDRDFILTLARFADGLLSEEAVRKKYRLDAAAWESLGNNDALVEAIELEKQKRIRDGSTARERAQILYAQAPTVLGGIMNDARAPARNRIESAKELRVVADNGPQVAPAATAEKFMIVINIGNDEVLKYPPSADKILNVSPKVIEHDSEPHDNDDPDEQQLATPWGLFLTATNKQGSDGNGGQSL